MSRQILLDHNSPNFSYHKKKTLTLVVPVILESHDNNGRRSTAYVNVDSLSVNTPVKNLIIQVHQKPLNARVDVYADCVYEGSIPLKKTFRNIAESEDSPFTEVVRIKNIYCQTDILR